MTILVPVGTAVDFGSAGAFLLLATVWTAGVFLGWALAARAVIRAGASRIDQNGCLAITLRLAGGAGAGVAAVMLTKAVLPV